MGILREGRRDALAWAASVAVYLAVAVAVLSPVWSGRMEPKWDGSGFNYPAFAYSADALRSGHLPLWDPFTACGQPFFSDPQYAWYHPGAVAASFLRHSRLAAYLLYWVGTWIWAGLGAFALAAVLGAGPAGCAVAALSFGLGGFFVAHGQHLPYVVTAAWIPWFLAFAHRAVARVSWADALLAGVTLALSATGGYAGLVIFELIAVVGWLALAFLVPGAGPAAAHPLPLRRRAAWIVAVLAVSVGVLAVVWAPGLWAFLVEAATFTDRTRPVADATALYGNPFTLPAAISFLFPRATIDLCTASPSACLGSDISMLNVYAGALAIPLAAIFVVHEGRRAWWIVAFAAFWFWVSLGGEAGLRTVLHHLIPPTRYMRHNGMLRVLFLVPLCVAAGLGATRLLGPGRGVGARVLAAWVAIALVCVGLVAWRFGLARELWGRGAVLASLGGAVAAWALPRRAAWALGVVLVAIFAADLARHVRKNDFTIGDRERSERLREAEAGHTFGDPMAPRATGPYYKLSKLNLVTRTPAVEGYVTLSSRSFEPLQTGPFLEVLAADRYWLSPATSPAPEREAGIAALARLSGKDAIPIFVERADEALPGAPIVPGTFGTTRVISYSPERVELEASVPPGPGAVLASTERIAPSWRVQVDGSERPISVVNYFFRGVRLPAGTHRVVFEYRPRPFVPLWVLSQVALIAAVAGAVVLERRARRSALAAPRTAPSLARPDQIARDSTA